MNANNFYLHKLISRSSSKVTLKRKKIISSETYLVGLDKLLYNLTDLSPDILSETSLAEV